MSSQACVDMSEHLMLDNGSSVDLCGNKNFLHSIGPAKHPIELNTSIGNENINLEGQLLDYGSMHFNEKNPHVNIMSFFNMQEMYRIVYDNAIENAFKVYNKETGELVARFDCINKVYLCKPSKKFFQALAKYKAQLREQVKVPAPSSEAAMANKVQFNIPTVKENLEGFSKREVAQAKEARKLWRICGAPSSKMFKKHLQMNTMKNCPVTVKDVDNAEKIWGSPIAEKKGKNTRKRRECVQDDLIQLPDELANYEKALMLCMDVMHVEGFPFLVSIDKSVRYHAAVSLNKEEDVDIYNGLDIIL